MELINRHGRIHWDWGAWDKWSHEMSCVHNAEHLLIDPCRPSLRQCSFPLSVKHPGAPPQSSLPRGFIFMTAETPSSRETGILHQGYSGTHRVWSAQCRGVGSSGLGRAAGMAGRVKPFSCVMEKVHLRICHLVHWIREEGCVLRAPRSWKCWFESTGCIEQELRKTFLHHQAAPTPCHLPREWICSPLVVQPLIHALKPQTPDGGNGKGAAFVFPSNSSGLLLLCVVSCGCRCLPFTCVHLVGTLPFCVCGLLSLC